MMVKNLFFSSLLFLVTLWIAADADYADLSRDDAQKKIAEILNHHGFEKELNPTLTRRILKNYVNLIDPKHDLLTQSENEKWTDPSDTFVQQTLQQLKDGNYAAFDQIYLRTHQDNAEEKQMLTYLVKAVASSLDPHTKYYTPKEAKQLLIAIQRKFHGIGIILRYDEDGYTITDIIEEAPAGKRGQLQVNDRLLAVDNQPVGGLHMIDVTSMIRGPKGSTVTLTVLRQSEEEEKELNISIQRGEIVLGKGRIESSYRPYQGGIIGHVRVHSMYKDERSNTSLDIARIINEWKQNHDLKGVIVDLRGNPGGFMPESVKTAGLFMKRGVVVTMIDHTGKQKHLRNLRDNPMWEGPLIILVDRSTASAAEVIAGSLQDYGRALIIGDDHTYGKGTYQTFRFIKFGNDLKNPKGSYKVTVGRYYTVLGRSPQLIGIEPDIIVPGPLYKSKVGERYLDNPIGSDSIHHHFNDILEDMPPVQRKRMRDLCLTNTQEVECTFYPFLENLKKNSKERIDRNPKYQQILNELEKGRKDLHEEGQELQLEEAFNIMEEIIQMEQERELLDEQIEWKFRSHQNSKTKHTN